MWIGVISLFPDMFRAITDFGVTGRAVKRGLLNIQCWNPRDFAMINIALLMIARMVVVLEC